ncbi:MAG: hypothetical protein AB2A00_34145 [Myxococcota bacterium]
MLHRVVRGHLPAFLRADEEADSGLPAFIAKTFRAYLRCGIAEH